MKKPVLFGGLGAVALASFVAVALPAMRPAGMAAGAKAEEIGAKATLINAAGEAVGVATITQEEDGVAIQVEGQNLPPGFHGFHVHATGRCDHAPPAFASAGGHYNPRGHSHADHAADLPVLLVNADGAAQARFKTDRFALAELFDADGSAFIIHADPDNYANIPARYGTPDAATLATGDAGPRIACGVIQPEQ